MPRLTKAQINELIATGSTEGAVDGIHWTGHPGLYVQIKRGKPSWLFRYNQRRRNRSMGLGPLHRVTYQTAIAEATRWKAVFDAGGDPIEIRRAEQDARAESKPRVTDDALVRTSKGAPTFRRAARAFIEFASPGWRDEKAEIGWARRLRRYAYPTLADRPIDTIGVEDVAKVIAPLWRDMPPTGKKVLGHLRLIFRHAIAHDWHPGPNPADLNASPKLLVLLGGTQRHTTKHFRSLDWPDVPACWTAVTGESGVPAACLRLVMLTVVRPTVARAADWAEFDMAKALWSVPAERMKMSRPHRVPLAPAARAVLEEQGPRDSGLVFPAPNGKLMADTSMNRVLDRLGFDCVPHGFRASFTAWAREKERIDREVRELVLAHEERSATARAYERTDLLETRREVMARWAAFVTGSER